MVKKVIAMAALALTVGAAFFILRGRGPSNSRPRLDSFVRTRGSRFVIGGRPFRFVGANVAVMYRDEDRAAMPETLARASQAGIRVVRVWASGEGGPNDVGPLADFADWPRTHPFRFAPDKWNEEALVHLDKVIAEAAANRLHVQLCLANWWRDTGGVTQYLRWAGINDAADDKFAFGINPERAMLFYTNEETRRLYRQHVEKIVTRRNTVTGTLYRDDPNIFGWELMNEAQVVTGHWTERRAWIKEMSAYLKSLDQNHIVTPGDWGYRTAVESREWLADHQLANIDYCDVHNYPRPDENSFVDSPTAMREFIDNRAAAAFSIRKPLVFGEFGMGVEGHNGFSQAEWFRAFFESNVRAGSGGAMFWILTPDPARGYGVTYTTTRDEGVWAEVTRASRMFASLESAEPPERLTEATHYLVPRQFAWMRSAGDPATIPQKLLRDDPSILYRFKPRMASAERFEKLGSGSGYIWGFGVGNLDYVVPAREDRRRVSEIIVRAHIQPVPPVDAKPQDIKTRVRLFINGTDCGSRLVSAEATGQTLIQEWRVDSFWVRLRAMRGLPLTIRFAVIPEADWPYGVNISNWPAGYEAHDAKPVEVEIRRK
ncbi:MAG: cellulase family glycosylhydrolase [Acidobacteriota bacterium]|nr:cellulase family glycosylhydrolase [Acidobacteriota bacterium]